MGLHLVEEKIRDVPDFPKKGILFKDITPMLQDAETLRIAADHLYDRLKDQGVDAVVGIESRGFIFGSLLAYRLGVGFVPVRKLGKLPWNTEKVSYELEYGESSLEIHQDAVAPGQKVVIVDDLLATGGTAEATAQLIEKLGAEIHSIGFIIELSFLEGRQKLAPHEIFSLIQY